MMERIRKQDWVFAIDKKLIPKNLKSLRYAISALIEKLIGLRLGEHKNYKMVKSKT